MVIISHCSKSQFILYAPEPIYKIKTWIQMFKWKFKIFCEPEYWNNSYLNKQLSIISDNCQECIIIQAATYDWKQKDTPNSKIIYL